MIVRLRLRMGRFKINVHASTSKAILKLYFLVGVWRRGRWLALSIIMIDVKP